MKSKLLSSVYHDNHNEGRILEIQYFDDMLAISIEWPVGEGAGMRAESFTITAVEARELARYILERIPDPAILEDNLLAIQG